MAIEVSQNENISEGKSARKKAVGLAVCRREAIRPQVLQYHPGARKEGVSGSLSGRRSEEVNQSNTSSPWGVRSTF